eukprot:s188_g6.t4
MGPMGSKSGRRMNVEMLECGAGFTKMVPVTNPPSKPVVKWSRLAEGSFPNPYLAIDLNDKQGVWQKETALSKALGQDPAVGCRHRAQGQGFLRPAGLRTALNLGATCYLNSLLQYLFFNLDFRYSFLRAPAQSKVVATLQEVFALLAEGESLVVDPKDFITAARVDALEQADLEVYSLENHVFMGLNRG